MLLGTVILPVLCMSLGMCATLGSYQTAQMEEGAHTVDIVTASKEAPEAALGPGLSSNFGSNSQTIDTYEVDVSAADGAGTDKDRPFGDASYLQTVTADPAPPKQPSPVKERNDISPVQTKSPSGPLAPEESGWSLSSIRKRFQTVHGYFDSLVELAGGQNGVCQYRCRYGKSHSLESTSGSWQCRKKKRRSKLASFLFALTLLGVSLLVIDFRIMCSLCRSGVLEPSPQGLQSSQVFCPPGNKLFTW